MSLSIFSGSENGKSQSSSDSDSQKNPVNGTKSSGSGDSRPRWFRTEHRTSIMDVTILPPPEEQKERKFRLLLSFGTSQDPSSQLRRTENCRGVEMEVEEKDLQPLARLVGRGIIVHYMIQSNDILEKNLREKNQQLQEEIVSLRRKLRMTQDQLEFTVTTQLRNAR